MLGLVVGLLRLAGAALYTVFYLIIAIWVVVNDLVKPRKPQSEISPSPDYDPDMDFDGINYYGCDASDDDDDDSQSPYNQARRMIGRAYPYNYRDVSGAN